MKHSYGDTLIVNKNEAGDWTIQVPEITGSISDIISSLEGITVDLESFNEDLKYEQQGFVELVCYGLIDEDYVDDDIYVYYTVPYEWIKKIATEKEYKYVHTFVEESNYDSEFYLHAEKENVILKEESVGK